MISVREDKPEAQNGTRKKVDQVRDYIVDRLQNNDSAAEGPILPPRLAAGIRVPTVSGLRLAQTFPNTDGSTFNIVWNNIEEAPGVRVRQYNIFVIGLLPNNVPTGPYTAERSPATISVVAPNGAVLSFVVQSELTSGLTSEFSNSPSTTGTVVQTAISGSTIAPNSVPPNRITNSTPFNILGWDAGGTAASLSRQFLDLVLGHSALPTPGLVPYVTSSGTLGSEAGFSYNSGTNTLTVPNLSVGGTFAFTNASVGSLVTGTRTISSDDSLNSDDFTVRLDASGGNVTLELPASPSTGRLVSVKVADTGGGANTASVDGNGNNIDGSPSLSSTAQYDGWLLQFNGSDWDILSQVP